VFCPNFLLQSKRILILDQLGVIEVLLAEFSHCNDIHAAEEA